MRLFINSHGELCNDLICHIIGLRMVNHPSGALMLLWTSYMEKSEGSNVELNDWQKFIGWLKGGNP